jgi:glycosyltransferase involved in cell wall biosynthesis
MNLASNTPLVSTIALCYNQAKFAVETLESIRNQSYQNIELIIMDDCSADNSVEVIENWIQETKYPCIFIKHNKNQGICKTLNEAFSHCQGQYLQMIACDDIMLPEKTTVQVELLNEHPDNAAVVYSDAYLIKDDGSPHYGWFIQKYRAFADIPSGNIYNELLAGPFIPAMSTLTKTEVIKKIGGWDEKLAYEDYDFWLRAAEHYDFIFSSFPSVKYRFHANNSSKSIKWADSQFWIYNKHLNNAIARENLYRYFFELYSTDLASIEHRNAYIKTSPSSFSAKLIKLGIPYRLYKFMRNIANLLN